MFFSFIRTCGYVINVWICGTFLHLSHEWWYGAIVQRFDQNLLSLLGLWLLCSMVRSFWHKSQIVPQFSQIVPSFYKRTCNKVSVWRVIIIQCSVRPGEIKEYMYPSTQYAEYGNCTQEPFLKKAFCAHQNRSITRGSVGPTKSFAPLSSPTFHVPCLHFYFLSSVWWGLIYTNEWTGNLSGNFFFGFFLKGTDW